MATNSKIEWTTHTFNPWWGCTKVSDGCKFCYAEALSRRYGSDVWGPGKPRRTFGDKHWAEPLKWNMEAQRLDTRFRVFCASMADVFDPAAPAGQLERLWNLMAQTPYLDWQILTKRPERIYDNLPGDWGYGYPNVWLGTSVEDERVLDRIYDLRAVPALIRFLSLEPLIGPLENLPLDGIHWVIVGGESGPKARPMKKAWVVSIFRQCRAANVPFFFKQWGGARKHMTGRTLYGRTYDELPKLCNEGLLAN
ncbi:MAG: phage Gp37/Gp68 family protein [Armatimonadota bacterium]|nr:phage Gp37/Gp68 family protein [Armatimonadota bacterium]